MACGDPLVGSWHSAPIDFSYGTSGPGNGSYVLTCTIESNSKFQFESVATYLDGNDADGCVDANHSNGTYNESHDDRGDILTLTFLGGTKMTSGCADTTRDVDKTEVPADDLIADVPGGGNQFAYTIDDDTLSLTLTYGTEGSTPTLFTKQ